METRLRQLCAVGGKPRALGTRSPGELSDTEAGRLPCREEHRQDSAAWQTGCWGSPGRRSGGCRTKSTFKSPLSMTLGCLGAPRGWDTGSAQGVRVGSRRLGTACPDCPRSQRRR